MSFIFLWVQKSLFVPFLNFWGRFWVESNVICWHTFGFLLFVPFKCVFFWRQKRIYLRRAFAISLLVFSSGRSMDKWVHTITVGGFLFFLSSNCNLYQWVKYSKCVSIFKYIKFKSKQVILGMSVNI